MFKPILSLLAETYSGERAKRHVEELARFHRIQASPGLRAAADYCYDHFKSLGLNADILRFAGDGVTRYWSTLMPQEWDCTQAHLRLVAPADKAGLLADFAEHKIAVIQRSIATPPEGIEADVIALDNGNEDKDYSGLEVSGKIVLTKGDLRRVHDLAVQRRGAIGIIYDGMREQLPVRPPFDLAEAMQYTSFWWRPEDTRCFGFVLSPRAGEDLRRTIRSAAERGESVRVHARIASSFVNGNMDAPTAVIPGETDEEILLVAHICHPQPSANDNASGVATLLEAARALQTLITDGKLPRPRRSIRFLLPPEIYGTFAYLASDEQRTGRTLAAINLDMVGEDQDLCGSSFLVERLPQAMPAPVDALAIAIQESLAQAPNGMSDLGVITLFRYGNSPFNGGSDHIALSDPTVGIACPMLIEWPDRFYHTSWDTPDKVDPRSLRLAGLTSATYAAFLASASGEESAWLAYEAQTQFKATLARTAQDAVTAMRLMKNDDGGAGLARDLDWLKKRLLFLADRQQASLAWLERLGGESVVKTLRILQSEAATVAWHEATAQSEIVEGLALRAGLRKLPEPPAQALDEWEKTAQAIVPVRRYRGLPELSSYLSRLSPEERDEWRATVQAHSATPATLLDLALYWADGKRTLLEIADLVQLETGLRDVEYMVQYVRLLQELSLA